MPHLTLDDLQRILDQLGAGRGPARGPLSRFDALHQRIRTREAHLYNAPEADPRFGAPWEDAQPWQSDIARRSWSQLRDRLTEHPFRIHIQAPEEAPEEATEDATGESAGGDLRARRAANDLERVLEHGLQLVQERAGFSIQNDLAYAQVCLCYGVLHWQRADDRLPTAAAPRSGETRQERRERERRASARAGFPWQIEVVRPDQFAFIEDRGAENGLALAVVVRETALGLYREALRSQDGLRIGGDPHAPPDRPRLRIGPEREAPQPDEPSGGGWGDRVRVASVWTRDEYYELAAPGGMSGGGGGGGEWALVKAAEHAYEMPPFAIAAADVNHHPDPVRRWEPSLEGVYRVKPLFDRERSLGRFLAEQAAIPLFWVQLASGAWELDESGARVELSADAAAARTLPEGATLHKVDFELESAFVEFLRMSAEELEAAAPDTGAFAPGEVGPNTQPHTLNILLGARNAQVLRLKQRQAEAVRTMLRNMALVMSKPLEEGGFGEPVWVFAKSRSGRLLERTVVGVDPADIPSLDIEVRIDPWSQSQRVAIQEHGRARLNDPLDPLDQRTYLEQYIGDEHPDAALRRYEEWQLRQARLARLARLRGRLSGAADDKTGDKMGSGPQPPASRVRQPRADLAPLEPLGPSADESP